MSRTCKIDLNMGFEGNIDCFDTYLCVNVVLWVFLKAAVGKVLPIGGLSCL